MAGDPYRNFNACVDRRTASGGARPHACARDRCARPAGRPGTKNQPEPPRARSPVVRLRPRPPAGRCLHCSPLRRAQAAQSETPEATGSKDDSRTGQQCNDGVRRVLYALLVPPPPIQSSPDDEFNPRGRRASSSCSCTPYVYLR